ncbi:hypothetical protein A9Q86_05825 [Flavobacteriales bacterium 33_180_T64]|nr:hypothetical protein A9Q86_05825 [Flavobacteriales bacterium 33_180_T64]
MKKIPQLLFLILLFNVNSCQKEDIGPSEIDNQDILEINKETNFNNLPTTSEAGAIENTMQWVSFMITQVLIKEEVNATQQFMDDYVEGMNGNGFSIIKLSDLLDENRSNQSFRIAFESEYYIFTDENGNSCENQGKPKLRPTPPPCEPLPCATNNLFETFVDYLIIDHCLELYVSNNFNSTQNIVSTAHPMVNNLTSNTGFAHSKISECIVDEVIFESYAIGPAMNNFIVVRPYRDGVNCAYDQFSSIPDFSLFPY